MLTDHLIGTLRKDQVRDKLKDLMNDKLDALKGKGIINGSASPPRSVHTSANC